jgi:uncharacterized membrane protein
MLHGLRLVTLHPTLVHATLGALPLAILAYVIGALRKSERWTFVGDAALVFTAAVTVLTFAFGLVSNATVRWPGGLSLWRWLHLTLGVLSTGLLLGFAGFRLARRATVPIATVRAAGFAVAVGVVVAFTGWVGGEVLVYHAGVAVEAAAQGALAPPVTARATPRNLDASMDAIRATWSAITTTLAGMLVHRPSDQEFDSVAHQARQLRGLADWMAVNGSRTLFNPNGTVAEHTHGSGGACEVQGLPARGGGPESAPEKRADHLVEMARAFGDQASRLETAAYAHDLEAMNRTLGTLSSQCAGCHAQLRWR